MAKRSKNKLKKVERDCFRLNCQWFWMLVFWVALVTPARRRQCVRYWRESRYAKQRCQSNVVRRPCLWPIVSLFRTIYYEMVLWYQFYPTEHVVLLAVSGEIPHQTHLYLWQCSSVVRICKMAHLPGMSKDIPQWCWYTIIVCISAPRWDNQSGLDN